jgi:protein-S-isoprenylcysteine O-methyltransferase Ste14
VSLLPPLISVPTGLLTLLLGGFLAVWGKRSMEHAGTNIDPRFPAKVLVVTGPFAFSRNPLYFARILLYVGLALAMNTAWPMVTLLPVLGIIHFGVIRREERYLEARFGDAYRRYRTRVRRWM